MSKKYKIFPIVALCLGPVVLSDARAAEEMPKTCEEAVSSCGARAGKIKLDQTEEALFAEDGRVFLFI